MQKHVSGEGIPGVPKLGVFALWDELVLAAIPAKLPTIRTVMALERSSVFMGILLQTFPLY